MNGVYVLPFCLFLIKIYYQSLYDLIVEGKTCQETIKGLQPCIQRNKPYDRLNDCYFYVTPFSLS